MQRVSKENMIGAILGDIVGSHYENYPTKHLDFEPFMESTRFTDDTVLTVAVADWILNGGELANYFHDYVDRYPHAGYGGTFIKWAWARETEPYNSWGNGSAMRVSPAGYAADSLEEVIELAKKTAEVTHDHEDGIRGAQATAACIFLARTGATKPEIQELVTERFEYNLARRLNEIRPEYIFDVSCSGSVPESIISFLESETYEEAIRNAISLGGDSDTMACIAGAIAEPFYGVIPAQLHLEAWKYLDDRLRMVIESFYDKYIPKPPQFA